MDLLVFGGENADFASDLELYNGEVILAGVTFSSSLSGISMYNTFSGLIDGILVYVTEDPYGYFIGGTDSDYLHSLTSNGEYLYFAGTTSSLDLNTTENALFPDFIEGEVDAFIGYFHENQIDFLSYYGGGGSEFGLHLTSTASSTYLGGYAQSFDINLYDQQVDYNRGGTDYYLTRFSSDLSTVEWTTYFGGNRSEVTLNMKR